MLSFETACQLVDDLDNRGIDAFMVEDFDSPYLGEGHVIAVALDNPADTPRALGLAEEDYNLKLRTRQEITPEGPVTVMF